ncbi:MAG TPA: DUF3352 domain-containing protein [Chthonomonadaceae bacterium]|nr:DUF3352 domain-containing protein [Chthonomonadaceae bacterium]
MATHPFRRKRRRGGSRIPVLLILLAAVGGGFAAYHYYFNRPGEAAIRLIPSDAMLVVTLDTSPSPQQVPVFERIHNALQREKLDTQADQLMTTAFENSTVGKEIRPVVRNDFAFALWQPAGSAPSDSPAFAALIALKDSGKVTDILARHGTQGRQDGLTYYALDKPDVKAAVMGDYLVVSNKPIFLGRIDSVRRGETDSVAQSADYRAARAALPSDANLMVFISPRGMDRMQQQSRSAGVNSPFRNTRWTAIGVTVRNQGLETVWQVPMSAQGTPGAQSLAQIAPLDEQMLRHLPAGAYGMMALSQPGQYWSWVAQVIESDPNTQKKLNDGMAAFEKQTGLSVQRDLVNGLDGTSLWAAYPSSQDSHGVPDGLLVLEANNGADPAAMMAKVRSYLERATVKNGKPGVRFLPEQSNGITIWSLDPASQQQITHAVTDLVTSQTPMLKGPGSAASSANSGITTMAQGKGAVYAEVGKAILLASSRSLLDRALAAYAGHGASLADSPAYRNMRAQLPQGAQSALLIDLPGIMDTLRPSLARTVANSQSGITPDDVARIFGSTGTTGLVGSVRYDGKTFTTTLFVPLDYERLIHIIGTFSGHSQPPANQTM